MNIIAFDVFGTVVDFAAVDRNELKAYAAHLRKPEWSPLVLPKSWEHLPAHPDSVEGINRLRKKFIVVTLSNGPLGMMTRLCKNAGLTFDAIMPLELHKVFKPNPVAYGMLCQVFDREPEHFMMVSANKDFGDIEGAAHLGMKSVLIRHGKPNTIIELAEQLGC